MSVKTEKDLMSWEDIDFDIESALHDHFSEFEPWFWGEIADEAMRIMNLMFDDDIEKESPKYYVLQAACAQAASAAFQATAAALGVHPYSVRASVAHWYEKQDNLPQPVTAEEFLTECKSNSEWYAELLARSSAKEADK